MDKEFKKCSLKTQEYIQAAKENKDWFIEDIAEDQIIKNYDESLNFLMEYELINDAENRLKNFKKFIVRSKFLISEAKRFHELSEQEQVV